MDFFSTFIRRSRNFCQMGSNSDVFLFIYLFIYLFILVDEGREDNDDDPTLNAGLVAL